MIKRTRLIAAFFLAALVLGPGAAAAQEPVAPARILLGVGGEYLSHAIVWDEKTGSSLLSMGYATVRVGVEFPQRASIALLAGYGGCGWNGLVFRALPISVDYQAGSIGSVFLGAELDLPLVRPGDWEIGLGGRFLFSIGSTGDWTLTELNQVGTFDGKADWKRIQAGPSLTYRGFEMFSPFITVFYERLWGTFTMNENVNPLEGTEEKAVKGQGIIGASIGMIIEPGPSFRLKAEGALIPFTRLEGGLALSAGATVSAIVLF